ncbi:MAG: hypothetical protein M3R30_08170 [Candidatus Eremiobacteraeota bacterium]|nr:hypothetical protein [Candidatus Eremiobacteraeota bacterium]
MTEIERALLDIAEVRERLGASQRFKGYSGVAAILSGAFAGVAGIVQAVLVPDPQAQAPLYFSIWLICCACAAIVNYGAIAHWFVSDASVRDRWQTRTVGLAILPALVLGAAFTFALYDAGQVGFLPGVWCACYGAGLFASRTMVPRAVVPVAAFFMLIGIALLFVPAAIAMQPWVLALAFGCGQTAVGVFVLRERAERAT